MGSNDSIEDTLRLQLGSTDNDVTRVWYDASGGHHHS